MNRHPSGAPVARRFRWWHAAAVGVVANLASALPAGYNGDEDFYARLDTPPGAPPGWVFAPVWAVDNALTLASNLRVANPPASTGAPRGCWPRGWRGWPTPRTSPPPPRSAADPPRLSVPTLLVLAAPGPPACSVARGAGDGTARSLHPAAPDHDVNVVARWARRAGSSVSPSASRTAWVGSAPVRSRQWARTTQYGW